MKPNRAVEDLSIIELVFNENHPQIVREDLNRRRVRWGVDPLPPAGPSGPLARVHAAQDLTVDEKIVLLIELYEEFGAEGEPEYGLIAEDLILDRDKREARLHGSE